MKIFNAVCFCVLMDHKGKGVEEAHPDYVAKKLYVFENCAPASAFSLLDHENQSRVLKWCLRWGIDITLSH